MKLRTTLPASERTRHLLSLKLINLQNGMLNALELGRQLLRNFHHLMRSFYRNGSKLWPYTRSSNLIHQMFFPFSEGFSGIQPDLLQKRSEISWFESVAVRSKTIFCAQQDGALKKQQAKFGIALADIALTAYPGGKA